MQMCSVPSRLGSHPPHRNLCRGAEILISGKTEFCTKSGFAAACLLWPYIRDVHISIMCLLQRLFQGESKGWLNIPSRRSRQLIPIPHAGLCDASSIIHEPSAPHGEMPFIKHTSCWIITAPVNNPPCTYCSLQNTRMRGIVRGEQSAALFSWAPRWPRGLVRGSELFARPPPVGTDNCTAPLPQHSLSPRFPSAQPPGPAAEWMQLETIQLRHSRPPPGPSGGCGHQTLP